MTASKQPNSRYCFVCGIENPFGLKLAFYHTAPGEVSAEHTVSDSYQGYPGVVHGGVVAAMLDEICGRSHMEVEPPRFMYTARLDIRYRKNVPVGQQLTLVGKIGKRKRRTATAHGAIYSPNGELLAEAEALMVDIPPETYNQDDLQALGWKVYPDE